MNENNKVSILMVLYSTERGGAQTFILNILNSIDLSKFRIDFAITEDIINGIGKEIKERGCIIHYVPYFKVWNYKSFSLAWNKLLSENKYDIIHGHSTNSASIYLKIAKLYNCKTIAHSHSAGYRGNFFEKYIKKIFSRGTRKYSDYWFSCSEKAAIRLFGKKYKSYKNYYCIPNAVPVEKYQFSISYRNKIREELLIKNDEFVCGHIGSFSSPKNHDFIIDVFKEILEIKPNSKLILCGDGPLFDKIKYKVKVLHIDNNVFFIGSVSNVQEYLMCMDVMIFPSLFEGLPISVIEAQACGLPVYHSETITNEVDLTDLVHVLSLSKNAKFWAEKICLNNQKDRLKYYDDISNSKFNINNSIPLLEHLYIKLLKNE